MPAATGVCTNWNEQRGFGFIKDDNSHKDLFVHAKDVEDEQSRLYANDRVEFDVVSSAKGFRAVRVRIVYDVAEPESAAAD